MKRILLTITLLGLFSQLSLAQDYFEETSDDAPPPAKRVFFGGGFMAIPFGDFKFVNISPVVGYRFTPRVSGGLGASYLYTDRELALVGGGRFNVSSSQYGGRLFGRYRINEIYFAQTEFESINVELSNATGSETLREWVPGFFIGGGVFTPVFANASISFSVLYNFLHDNFKSPHSSALITRIGFVL